MDPAQVKSEEINELIGKIEEFIKNFPSANKTKFEEGLVALRETASAIDNLRPIVNDTRLSLINVDAKKDYLIAEVNDLLLTISDFLKVSDSHSLI